MKKLSFILIVIFFITLNAYSQTQKSQRVVLCEEFTQASSYFCGVFNPAYNALLKSDTGKVVSIKYHTSWPGVDPMNMQIDSQVVKRAAYYNATNLPTAIEDGNVYNGSPDTSYFNQANIDSEYTIKSPFLISLSHKLSTKYDSVFVKCIITYTDTVAGTFIGPLRAYIVMTEDTVTFATAPGSNGEKVFYDVMRKMYPSTSGADLPLTWAVGSADTITIAAPIPSCIFDLHKMSFVAFVQDNSDKNVKQAVYDAPVSIPNISSVTAIYGVPEMQCNNSSFTPLVAFKNTSTTSTLTSVNIVYRIDTGAIQTYVWNGSLAPGELNTIPIQTIYPTNGFHTLNVYTTPYIGLNYVTTVKFIIDSATNITPYIASFEDSIFPPKNWIIDNQLPYNWKSSNTSAYGAGSKSSSFPCFSIPVGNVAYMYSCNMNFSGFDAMKMTFDVAYAQYQNEEDQLEVQVSTDCGSTWSSLYTKSGATLATTSATTSAFTPTASQWRNELVDFAPVAGQADVLIRFKATSAWGNNIYVDNIYLASDVGINEIDLNNSIFISPNPFNTTSNLTLNLKESNDVSMKIMNVLGQKIYESNQGKLASGNHTIELNGSKLSSGIYFVNLTIGNNTITKKVSVTH